MRIRSLFFLAAATVLVPGFLAAFIAVETVKEAIESSAWQVVAGVGVALALALATAWLIGSRFVQALEVTSRAASALGAGVQPSVTSTGVHEIDALNETLQNAGRLLAAEIQAREKAQTESAAKDQFLAMLGHELRSPLAGITGATTLLLRGRTDEASLARYLGIIDRQSRHLTRIIDDLLEVSRALSGKIVLAPAPMDLSDCVNHCVNALRAGERAQGHLLTVDAQTVWVNADAVRMEQIVNNLVTHALKFSPPDGTVRVRLQATETQAVLEVSHDGGISAELLPGVFEPFVQGAGLHGRVQSGLGIGLALTRELVALHGGDAQAHNAGPGRGGLFTVTLPRMAAQAPTPPPETVVVPSGCRVLVNDNSSSANGHGPHNPP